MSQRGTIITVRTDPTTQFRGAQAQNVGAIEALAVPSLGLGVTARGRVVGVGLVLAENIGTWDVQFFSTQAGASGGVLTGSTFLGQAAISAVAQVGGAGSYFGFTGNLDVPIVDQTPAADGTKGNSQITVKLVNRAATGKSAGDAGALMLVLHVEPTLAG